MSEMNAMEKYTPDTEAERKLVRKIDMRIVSRILSFVVLLNRGYPQVPMIWLLYTMSYLDRANIGNAKVGGMETDLGLTSNQYSIILLVFFVCSFPRICLPV